MATKIKIGKPKPAPREPRNVVYSFAPGSQLHDKLAEAEAKRFEWLRTKHKQLTPEIAVDDAGNPSSPLHPLCEWDDTAAAHQYRLGQMRHVMACLRVEYDYGDRHVGPHRWLVNVRREAPDGGTETRQYFTVEMALSDDILRRRLIDDCLAAIESFKARYGDILCVDEVRDALRDLLG